jgi:collagenase-like PrtC family protease
VTTFTGLSERDQEMRERHMKRKAINDAKEKALLDKAKEDERQEQLKIKKIKNERHTAGFDITNKVDKNKNKDIVDSNTLKRSLDPEKVLSINMQIVKVKFHFFVS